MEQFKERFLRPCRKLTDMFPIAMLFTFALTLIGTILGMGLCNNGFFGFLGDPKLPDVSFALQYLTFFGIWPFFFLAFILPPANRRMLRDFMPNHRGNSLLGIFLGLLGGFGINAACVGLSVLLGDIGLEFTSFNAKSLIMLFIAVLIQSGAEEISTRQFLYEKLRRRYRSPWVAIILNALFFGALHMGNPGANIIGVGQCVLVGLVFSLFVYYFDGLWVAIMFHTAWNYTQSIIFGCPNSGAVSGYSLFRLLGASSGPFFDPEFGVEGSVGAVVFLAALFVALIVYARVKHLPTQDLWADAKEAQPDKAEHKPAHMAS